MIAWTTSGAGEGMGSHASNWHAASCIFQVGSLPLLLLLRLRTAVVVVGCYLRTVP